MTKLIRYLENKEWKYPTVRDVGDIEKLKTTDKTDLVSAINEITANGGGSPAVIQDIQDRVETLETDSSTQKDQIEKNRQSVETQGQQLSDLQEIQSELEMEDRKIREEVSNKLDTDVYTDQYNKVKEDLLDKVDSSKYKEDFSAITIQLGEKVNSIDFNGLKGRVDTVQTDVKNIEGEMSTKITRTEFDDAVGLNKWTASKYLTPDTNLNQTPPSFPLIKGRTPDEVAELDDSLSLIAFDGSGFITHLFTNVRLKTAKTLSLNLKYNDSLSVYMNGAKIYENKYNDQDPIKVSLSLRSGWNTIEILHGNQSGEPVLSLESSIASQVDKLTAVIGVGDKNETRLAQAETNIKQTEDAILLKAEKQEVTNIGNRVSNNESSLQVLNDQIKTKVEQQDFNKYSERLTNTESTVTQLSGEITSKVEQEDYNLLNDKVGSQGTQIQQLSDSISLKVDTEVFNGLEGRVKTNESEITATQKAIELKASQEDLDTTNGKLNTAEGQIKVLSGEISQTVKKTDFDKLNDRVVTSETAIKSNSESISLKANKDDVYSKNEADDNISNAVESAKAEIELTTDGISQNVSKLSGDVESVRSYASGIDQKADSISQSVSTLKSTVDDQGKTIESQKTSITSLNDSISLKAEKSDVYTKEEANGLVSSQISTAKSEIQQTTDSITSTVSDISTSVSSGLSNLIRNSSFKSGFDYWQVTSEYWTIDKSKLIEECYAVKAEVSGLTKNGYKAIYSEFIDVGSGQEITASVYSLIDDLSLDEGFDYSIEVEFYNDEESSRLSVEGVSIKPSSVNVWQRFYTVVKVPSGATKARIRIHPRRNGRIWVSRPMIVLGRTLPSNYSPMPSDSLMNSLATQIKQTADEVSVNVVKKGNVLSSINASQEGVKISGDKVDIEGMVTFSSLDSATQTKINGIENAANEARTSADKALSKGVLNGVNVGGAYSGGFIINENYSGNKNAGEIHVLFGKFIHPDGSVWVHPAGDSDGEISTSLEGDNTDTLAYIMFTGSDPSRFGPSKSGRKDSMFNLARFNGSKWQYNNNEGWIDFSPNTSDCIVAQVTRTAGSANGIDDITFFTTVTMVDGSSIRTGLLNTDTVTISGGGTTIDKNGVSVRNGNFTLEDQVSRQKVSLEKTRNFLKDHSFELLMGSTGTYNYDRSYMDFSSAGSEYRWFTSGTPKLITAYNQPLEFSYAIHGVNAMLVNSSNYVTQTVYQVGVGKTYTISGFFKKHSAHAGGKPKFKVSVNYQIENKIAWSQTKSFNTVPSNEDIVRYQFTFTIPSDITINGADKVLQVSVMGDDGNWIIADGIQLVQGDMATVYETDDALYNFASPYGFPEEAQQIKTKEIRGTNASRALYIYDVKEIQFSNNNSVWFDQYGNIKASDIVKTATWNIVDDNGVSLAKFPVGSNKANIVFGAKLEAEIIGSIRTPTTNLYLGADGEVRVTDSKMYNGGNINYRPIRASSFPTGSSVRYKDNIKEFNDSALEIIKDTKVFEYYLKNDLQKSIYDKRKVGFLNEAAPSLIRDEDGVDSYIVSSINWKATQELAYQAESFKKEIDDLEVVVDVLSAEVTESRKKIGELESRIEQLENLVRGLASEKE
ncbi:hypothetical protein MF621_004146 (plasmid) [Bacillus velezensis]|uniref:hypothetical protein n=1 Tax=Bacillus velezensis TaxID=492670 RepID=UPI0020251BB0|nr:hypothetical protein [Bacillus velezensis]URJ76439.1 hypothetical protein MF619_004012 [Bacillus velezensis]URJ80395.1 hypothetical protein MF621_004146 [Bacillus velezensis]